MKTDLKWFQTYCTRDKDEMNVLKTVYKRNSIVYETLFGRSYTF